MEFFGFEIKKSKRQEELENIKNSNSLGLSNEDAETDIYTDLHNTASLNFDASFSHQKEAIQYYRNMLDNFDVDNAVSDIINEFITISGENSGVSISLDDTKFSDNIKDKIRFEFEYLLGLLDMKTKGFDIILSWYVDSMIYYHVIMDMNKPTDGIKALSKLDPILMKRIRNIKYKSGANGKKIIDEVKRFYLYEDLEYGDSYKKFNNQGLAIDNKSVVISPDSIVHVHSGLINKEKNYIKGHLHKAIKPLNQLSSVEDSLVVFRLARAPQRRAFKVDVGPMQGKKAAAHIAKIRQNYKTNFSYDTATGQIKSKNKVMSILEDYWFPTRDGRGIEVESLDGDSNLGQIDDIIYFQKRLYKSLNVPISRLETENTISFGRVSEITRDELKFNKFISKLRIRFNVLFYELLRIQLISKKVMTADEWDDNKRFISFEYNQDFYMSEQKELDLIRERVELLDNISQYVGEYYSSNWVKRNVLRQSEDEIKDIQKEIKDANDDAEPDDGPDDGPDVETDADDRYF